MLHYFKYLRTHTFAVNRNIPKELEIDIQKYFYCCISRLAGLQAAFVSPTKVYTYMYLWIYKVTIVLSSGPQFINYMWMAIYIDSGTCFLLLQLTGGPPIGSSSNLHVCSITVALFQPTCQ